MSTATGNVLAFNCIAYRSASLLASAASSAVSAATWVPIPEVKDIKVPLENSEGDISTRGAGWELIAPVLTKAEIAINMPLQVDDANYQAIEAACIAKTPIAMAFMAVDITFTNTRGIAGNFSVLKMEREESLANAVQIAFSLKPFSFPQWFKI